MNAHIFLYLVTGVSPVMEQTFWLMRPQRSLDWIVH